MKRDVRMPTNCTTGSCIKSHQFEYIMRIQHHYHHHQQQQQQQQQKMRKKTKNSDRKVCAAQSETVCL